MEEDSGSLLSKKVKQEPMEVDEKKPELKVDPKDEDDRGAANSTTSSSPSQSRRKSEYAVRTGYDCKNLMFTHIRFLLLLTIHAVFLLSFYPLLFSPSFHRLSPLLLMSPSAPPAVFKPEELRQALMPTLESLYRQDPESLPFRQPVDPMQLGIPVGSNTHTQTRRRQTLSSAFLIKAGIQKEWSFPFRILTLVFCAIPFFSLL